ncbi:hypothetical protein DPMN_151773 [Dreissena polymorpha]|uniref:Uncharacterized protein n=1 Tax=Dreissena polymorpha TaxID=45954 RepID=A0A9D4FLU7_DREPO|nr:hypothetical protein DPMN_151773 [Dreissena polymorpha]
MTSFSTVENATRSLKGTALSMDPMTTYRTKRCQKVTQLKLTIRCQIALKSKRPK